MDDSQKAFAAFMKTMNGLQASTKKLEAVIAKNNKVMEENSKRMVALEKAIRDLDEHNAYLAHTVRELSGRLDLATGVTGIIQRLLPGRR